MKMVEFRLRQMFQVISEMGNFRSVALPPASAAPPGPAKSTTSWSGTGKPADLQLTFICGAHSAIHHLWRHLLRDGWLTKDPTHVCKNVWLFKKKKIQMIKSGTGADVRSSSTTISESVKDCVCCSNEKFSQSAFVCDMLIHLMERYTVYVYIATQPGNLFCLGGGIVFTALLGLSDFYNLRSHREEKISSLHVFGIVYSMHE